MPAHLAIFQNVTSMSTSAAAIGITAALALGFYFARWLQAERDEISLRTRLNAAIKVMWAARRALVVVVVIGWVVVDLWFRGNGR